MIVRRVIEAALVIMIVTGITSVSMVGISQSKMIEWQSTTESFNVYGGRALLEGLDYTGEFVNIPVYDSNGKLCVVVVPTELLQISNASCSTTGDAVLVVEYSQYFVSGDIARGYFLHCEELAALGIDGRFDSATIER